MSQPKTKILNLPKLATKTTAFLFLLATAVFLPAIIHNQAITGPIINATLLVASLMLGTSSAIMIGLVPSVVALSRGLLPLPLAPVVPFIMLANGLYIYLFAQLKKQSFAGAVAVASVAKFTLLHLVSQFLLANLLPAKFLIPAAKMMSWPQLATALIGGVIAYFIVYGLDLATNSDSN